MAAKRKAPVHRETEVMQWGEGPNMGEGHRLAYQRRWPLGLGRWPLPLPPRWGRAPRWYRCLPLAAGAWWKGWWFLSPGCGLFPPVWVTPAGHEQKATLGFPEARLHRRTLSRFQRTLRSPGDSSHSRRGSVGNCHSAKRPRVKTIQAHIHFLLELNERMWPNF